MGRPSPPFCAPAYRCGLPSSEWRQRLVAMRLLHTMLRVGDLERSIAFYTDVLAMRLLRRRENPGGRYTLAFVGYGEESETAVLELTWNWDHPANQEGYSHGSGYGHVAIGIPDLHGFCAQLAAQGVPIVTGPKSLLPGAPALAFIRDPDGYSIELIQTSRLTTPAP